jgi:hypothetical protein
MSLHGADTGWAVEMPPERHGGTQSGCRGQRRNLCPRAVLRDGNSQPGELGHGKVGLSFDGGDNCRPCIDIGAREVSGHPMDQRVLPGLEPLDTRQAVSQRLEGFEGGAQNLQRGFEPKAGVGCPPSVLVAAPVYVRPLDLNVTATAGSRCSGGGRFVAG